MNDEWVVYPEDAYEVGSSKVGLVYFGRREDSSSLTDEYLENGLVTTVLFVIMTHRWCVPHFLVVSWGKDNRHHLFGANVPPGENEHDYIKDLCSQSFNGTVGQLLGTYWETTGGTPAPFLPPHCTRPKQVIKLYQLTLNPGTRISVLPPNDPDAALRAVPITEAAASNNLLIQYLPHLISRFRITYCTPTNDQ